MDVAKDKKKKKGKKTAGKSGTLKALAGNPLVADVVAAALVATASALKDSKRARALASDAGDELTRLSKAGVKRGEALWEMALQIGRRSLEELVAGDKAAKPAKPPKTPKTPKTAKPPKAAKPPKPKTATKMSRKKRSSSGSSSR
jgi:hypothetical protein